MYPILKMLKSQQPDTECTTYTGKARTDKEENPVLRELEKKMDIEIIEQTNKKPIGGVKGRPPNLACKMYVNNASIETIMTKILETIKTKEKKVKITQEQNIVQQPVSLENEIFEMKGEIKELKNTIKELVDMMKEIKFNMENKNGPL